jgi:CRISPR-associated protein Cmr6
MKLPLYKDLIDHPPSFESDAHRGLRFERFFNCYNVDLDGQWKVVKKEEDKKKEDKKDKPDKTVQEWLVEEIAKFPAGDPSALTDYCCRHRTLVEKLRGKSAVFVTQWHFATGLGLPHPIENGLAWHPTLGTPYLAGSAVKGLMRAWLEVWEEDEQTREKKLRWLGSEDDKNPRAGELICFDAIPIAPVKLIVDVMTPHYGKWYEQGGEIKDYKAEPEKLPADWHEPNPVVFLAVDKPTSFLFSIAPRHPPKLPSDFAEIDEALDVLAEALKWLGAGAKTAVGYGHMKRDETDIKEVVKAELPVKEVAEPALAAEEKALRHLQQAFEKAKATQEKSGGPLSTLLNSFLSVAETWPLSYRQQLADKTEEIYQSLGWWWKNSKKKQEKIAKLRQSR